MDEIFGKIGSRFKVSITDSTMMWILHCAMNKAHERVQTRNGAIQRLNEISKFYQLAVMQLEGCLKFLLEEADSNFESSDEEVMGELIEIRDRLQGRLRESELAISEKDRELNERNERELILRHALKVKDEELESLRAKLVKVEKTQSVEDLNLENHICTDDNSNGEICDPKNLIDQQVFNSKQKVEPEYEYGNIYGSHGLGNLLKIEDMSADIDILKETLDIAIGKMECVISLSEFESAEHQWTRTIETDTNTILLRGFIKDVQERFLTVLRRQEKEISSTFRVRLSNIVKGVRQLQDELEDLNAKQTSLDSKPPLKAKARSEDESERRPDGLTRRTSVPLKAKARSEDESERKPDDWIRRTSAPLKAKARSVEESERKPDHLTRRTSAPELANRLDQLAEEESNNIKGNFVAKMIKNHESIIRRKSQELNWLNREIFGDKGKSFYRKDGEHISLRRRVQKFIKELEDLADWDLKSDSKIHDHYSDESEQISSRKLHRSMSLQSEHHVDRPEDIDEKSNAFLVSHWKYAGVPRKVRMLKKEVEKERNLESLLRKEIYVILLESILNEYHSTIRRYAMNEEAMRKMANQQNEQIERSKLQVQIQQQLQLVIFKGTINEILSYMNTALRELQTVKSENNRLHDRYLKAMSSKDVWMILMKEMLREWEIHIAAYNFQNCVREEINQLVITKAIKEATEDSTFEDDWFLKSPETNGEEILMGKQDSLLKHVEFEEDLIEIATEEVKDFNAQVDLVELVEEEPEMLQISQEWIAEMENTLASVGAKVEKALEQLAVSKAILNELRSTLDTSNNNSKRLDYQTIPAGKLEGSWFQCKAEEIAMVDSTFVPIMRFSQAFMDFKCIAETKLNMNNRRLEEARSRLNPLVQVVRSIKRKESVYRKAFTRRCENLKKAEAEVDMLGDQVDLLLGLLGKTYNVFKHYSPVFQQQFQVSEIMDKIKKELSRGLVDSGCGIKNDLNMSFKHNCSFTDLSF